GALRALHSFPTRRSSDLVDLADDLLEHVLDRREPGHAAVLVDDDRHVIVTLPELREQRVQPLAFRDEDGGPEQRLEVDRVDLLAEILQEILREQDADDLVAILADHGEARMAGLDDGLDQALERLVLLEDDHLRARHHDVAHLGLRDLEHALEHRVLVRGEQTAMAALGKERGDLFAAFELVGAAVEQARPPTGQAWAVASGGQIVGHRMNRILGARTGSFKRRTARSASYGSPKP